MVLPQYGNNFIITETNTITRINYLLADRFPDGAVITLLFQDAGLTVVTNPFLELRGGSFNSNAYSALSLVHVGSGVWRELYRQL